MIKWEISDSNVFKFRSCLELFDETIYKCLIYRTTLPEVNSGQVILSFVLGKYGMKNSGSTGNQ